MKNKYKKAALLCAGMLLGAALVGGAAAAGVLAEPSRQAIYVDGEQVPMTAFSMKNERAQQRPRRLLHALSTSRSFMVVIAGVLWQKAIPRLSVRDRRNSC